MSGLLLLIYLNLNNIIFVQKVGFMNQKSFQDNLKTNRTMETVQRDRDWISK